MSRDKTYHLKESPLNSSKKQTLKLMAVNTKPPCYEPADLKRLEQKRGEIGMSSLALLKVRVAYLQCGQSSP